MKTYGVELSLIASLALSACALAPPAGTETQPMLLSPVDTSWKVGKGLI
jgi:hypothetical protein